MQIIEIEYTWDEASKCATNDERIFNAYQYPNINIIHFSHDKTVL